MSKGGKYLKPKAAKKGKGKKTLLIVLCAILALVLAVLIGAYIVLNRTKRTNG